MMEVSFVQKNVVATVSFGEPLNQVVPREKISGRHVIVFTNQKYYDRSFEKISGLFSEACEVDWYICTNQVYCNNLTELMSLMQFLASFPQEHHYLFCGFGNEGVMALSGFVQKTSVLDADYWCLPVSVRSLAKALLLEHGIVEKNGHKLLQVENLPPAIYYDQTIAEEQKDGKLVDLLIFIRCGLVCDHEFLRKLYVNYTDRQKIFSRSFTALIEELLKYYQSSGENLEEFGELFALAFYESQAGHLLSSNMKRLFGIIFHLLWTNVVHPLDFQLQNFLKWLLKIGYPIEIPSQLSLSEYGENVLKLSQKRKSLVVLTEIGKIGGLQKPTVEELVKMIDDYQQILEEIRGI